MFIATTAYEAVECSVICSMFIMCYKLREKKILETTYGKFHFTSILCIHICMKRIFERST